MADANIATIDKVGLPGPDTSRPAVGPGQSFLAVCPPASAHLTEREQANFASKPADKPEPIVGGRKPNGINGGLGHSSSAPKPVEVASVPQTPLNNSTPAGGTPRPELRIAEEPERADAEAPNEPIVLFEVEPAPVGLASQEAFEAGEPKEALEAAEEREQSTSESLPYTAPVISHAPGPVPKESLVNGSASADTKQNKPEASVTHIGPQSHSVPAPAPPPTSAAVAPPAPISDTSSSRGADPLSTNEPAKSGKDSGLIVGEKRKLDEEPATVALKPLAEDNTALSATPMEKKPKIDDALAEPEEQEVATGSAEPTSSPPKASKPKKEKKHPPVGRTARKTRSQGPADL